MTTSTIFEGTSTADLAVPRLQLLGGLRLLGPDVDLAFRTRKTTALFAYLALRAGQPHSRDFLCELFWPDAESGAARLSLRVALSSLRKTLADLEFGGELLRIDGDFVSVSGACWIDALAFENLSTVAGEVEEHSDRIQALEAAIQAYTGPLVPDCDELLLATERERLADMAARLWRRLGQTHYRLKQFEEALAAADRSLELELDSEAAYRIAIRSELALGRTEQAAQRFKRLEMILLADGRAAEPKTIRLGEELFSGAKRDRRETTVTVAVRAEDLPNPLTPFFGRQEELEKLSKLFTDPREDVRLLTLLGIGGSGKTRLAIEVARKVAADSEARVAWFSLAGKRSVAEVRASIASAFSIEATGSALGAEIVRRTQEPLIILALDNLEHLVHSELTNLRELIVELVSSSPRLRVLGASRVPTDVPGEFRFVVPALPLPEHNPTANAARSVPAVALFVDRARRRRSDFELDETNVADVTEIVARLDGLPLALELAAIWATTLTPATLVQRIADRFELLATDGAEVDPRHQRLESVIEASVDYLPEEVRELYFCLCVLPDAAPLEVIQAVGGLESQLQVAALLTVLVERAIARRERRPGQDSELFIIPECLREYGVLRLNPGQKARVMRRLAAHLRDTLRLGDAKSKADFLKVGRDIRPLMPHVQGVLAWCAEEGEYELGLEVATAWPTIWSITNRHLVGRQFLTQLLEKAEALSPLEIRALLLASKLSMEGGEILGAEPFVDRLVAIEDSLSVVDWARFVSLRIQIYGFRLDQQASNKYRVQLEEMLKQPRSMDEEMEMLGVLGTAYGDLNEHARAVELGDRILLLARRNGDRFQIGMVLEGVAFNLMCTDSYNRAEASILEAIDIARDTNHLAGLAHRLWLYGCVIQGKNRVRAREVWLESLEYHRELNNRQSILWVLGNLAMADVEDQEFDRAIEYLKERIVHCISVNDTGALQQTYNWLIRVHISVRAWGQVLELAEERLVAPSAPTEPVGNIEHGWIAEQAGKFDEAKQFYEAALVDVSGDQVLSTLVLLLLRRPVADEAAVHDLLDQIDSSRGNSFGRTRSEIVCHAIRSVRLRHAVTPL